MALCRRRWCGPLAGTFVAVWGVLGSGIARAQDAPLPAGSPPEPELPDLAPPSPHAPPVQPIAPVPRAPPPPVPYTPPPEPEPATLLSGTRVSHGGYVGPGAKLTSLASSTALLIGAEGGWIIGHVLSLGGGAYSLASDASSPDALQTPGGRRATLSLTYGGARIAFIPSARRTIHLAFGMLVGGGRVSSSAAGEESIGGNFFAVEPDAAFEASVARPIRIAMGASYRITGGTSITSLTPTALSGPTAFLAIKLGVF